MALSTSSCPSVSATEHHSVWLTVQANCLRDMQSYLLQWKNLKTYTLSILFDTHTYMYRHTQYVCTTIYIALPTVKSDYINDPSNVTSCYC